MYFFIKITIKLKKIRYNNLLIYIKIKFIIKINMYKIKY